MFIRLFGFFIFMILLIGCPAKTKTLYLKIALSKEVVVKDFLAVIGNNVKAPLADKDVGFHFLTTQCEHRWYESKNENNLFGACLLKRSIYIYALLPDRGDDPQKYFGSFGETETLSKIDQYRKNAESYLKESKVPYHSDGFYVADKLKFIHMLEDEAKQEKR